MFNSILVDNVNLWGLIIQVGMLFIAIITVHQSTKKAISDKLDAKIDAKADKSYVDKEISHVRDKIDDKTESLNQNMKDLKEGMGIMTNDIKEILKQLAK